MAKLSIALLKSVVATYVDGNDIGVDSYAETRANSVGLLDTLGKIYTNWQNYGDKLDIFDGEDLSFGQTPCGTERSRWSGYPWRAER